MISRAESKICVRIKELMEAGMRKLLVSYPPLVDLNFSSLVRFVLLSRQLLFPCSFSRTKT